jgi:integron integrase
LERFHRFHGGIDLRHLGAEAIAAFANHLLLVRKVSPSTHSQALSALLFFYRQALGVDMEWIEGITRPKRLPRLPEVMTRREVRAVLDELRGLSWLMATLMYGSGLRLSECASLRIKDVDLESCILLVRDGKGGRDRRTILPKALLPHLTAQLERVRAQHQTDLRLGAGCVELPNAIARKYPNAGRSWPWQWLFPATRHYTDPKTSERRRHHIHPTKLQREFKEAVHRAGITKRVTCHTLRHSFATHLILDGYDTVTLQKLLGHKDIRTTMKYVHAAVRLRGGVRSPADVLLATPLDDPELE